MKDEGTRLLTSWKEIAQYLDVTVRTAQLWEKTRGLPVRRMPGPRGRVFMRVVELDAWLRSRDDEENFETSAAREQGASGAERGRSLRLAPLAQIAAFAALLAIAALLVAFSGGLVGSAGNSLSPSQWRVTEEQLVVLSEGGEELWRVTPGDSLAPDNYRNARHQPRFADLTDDGRPEVLFIARRPDFAAASPLVCYDPDGNELWRFDPGRTVRSGKEPFEDIYRVDQALPVRLSTGEMGVVVLSLHYMYYPTQVTLLSARDGTTLAEYWHSGYIGNETEAMQIADLDEDGRSELYLAGISNSYRQATLVVLDLEGMKGASLEEDPDYQLAGFDDPNEIARILFPRSAISVESGMFNAAVSVRLTPEFINVSTLENFDEDLPPQLTYHIRPDWTLDHVGTSSTFQAAHERLRRAGVLTIGYDEDVEGLESLSYVGRPRALVRSQ